MEPQGLGFKPHRVNVLLNFYLKFDAPGLRFRAPVFRVWGMGLEMQDLHILLTASYTKASIGHSAVVPLTICGQSGGGWFLNLRMKLCP